jgi:serine/threonine protein kinase
MLYLLVTGQLLFKGTTHRELKPWVLKGRFTIPSHLSAAGHSLIYCLLTHDPVQRPMMEGILLHPWLSATEERPPTHSSPTLPNRLDPTIMLVMIDMSFGPRQVLDSLLHRQCDEASCTYLCSSTRNTRALMHIVSSSQAYVLPASCPSFLLPSHPKECQCTRPLPHHLLVPWAPVRGWLTGMAGV